MRFLFFIVFSLQFFEVLVAQELSLEQANRLAKLPQKCIQQEYPNKLGQVLISDEELGSPKSLHPVFYGCFDWHSSVHGHWSLVYLLKNFPKLENREEIINFLNKNLTEANIKQEISYFSKKHEYSYERTYGWSWLMKLQMELDTYNNVYAQKWASNLRPLTQLIIDRYQSYLPKLQYPIRVGTHTNTAFGLNHAWDYSIYTNDVAFQKLIKENAIRLFVKDRNYPWQWEPNGYDFLSPTLEEVNLMRRVLDEGVFLKWFKKFAKDFLHKDFDWNYARVSDRNDGHLVHLDGLNFSRAWNMYELISFDYIRFKHLKPIADKHLEKALATLVDGNYEGEHWLASFALKALQERSKLESKFVQ